MKTKAVRHFCHKPGEYLEFDFAGDKLGFVDPGAGEYTECSVLVCVLPFSGYTYVEALLDQTREELMHGLNNCLHILEAFQETLLVTILQHGSGKNTDMNQVLRNMPISGR